MLILTRKLGERVRITVPDGYIWLTMLDGAIMCRDCGTEPLYASLGDAVYYDFEKGNETVEIRLLELRAPSSGHRIGIEAPKDWAILREELIGKEAKPIVEIT